MFNLIKFFSIDKLASNRKKSNPIREGLPY